MENLKNYGFSEMTENEVQSVEGGAIDWLAAAATAGTIWVLYEIGYAIGKGIAHATS